MITVCFKCQERKIGCHAICERYIEQSEQHRKQLEENRIQKEAYSAQLDRKIDGVVRMQKRRHH